MNSLEPSEINAVVAAFEAFRTGEGHLVIPILVPLGNSAESWTQPLLALAYTKERATTEALQALRRSLDLGQRWSARQTIEELFTNINLLPAPDMIEAARELSELAEIASREGPQESPIPLINGLIGLGLKDQARQVVREGWPTGPRVSSSMAEINAQDDQLKERMRALTSSIEAAQGELETKASVVLKLIEDARSGAVQAGWETQKSAREAEANNAWRGGLLVLGLAVAIAALPVVIGYCRDPAVTYGTAFITAHVTLAAALSGLAGVLLARARHRDELAVSADRFKTALGAMESYALSIDDRDARADFRNTLGRVLIEVYVGTSAVPDHHE